MVSGLADRRATRGTFVLRAGSLTLSTWHGRRTLLLRDIVKIDSGFWPTGSASAWLPLERVLGTRKRSAHTLVFVLEPGTRSDDRITVVPESITADTCRADMSP